MNPPDLHSIASWVGGWSLMWLGQAMHLLTKFTQLEEVNGPSAALAWIKTHPFTILNSMVAGVVAYIVLLATNQWTVLGAVACGFMATEIVNAVMEKQRAKIVEGVK